ncbi:hypothetical protein GQ43DRAFT_391645 [Delitschia confertaspora ATCC 74209]|uniref:Uncharacterized protein n=1 Tax=Delitschia confertaspora ATCC 74209 TaxID=1513339 RepID=A0A9P4MR76_9PLEO|nr:hypothetical protein GQ43DRAFT_391645 [Delitschia confertaspora ATCC 74209]
MKVSFVLTLVFGVVTMASPAAISLKRSTVEVEINGTLTQVACIECPCEGFFGPCKCVTQGCCCT